MKPNTRQKIYRPYNKTFDCYHDQNMQLGQAEAFIKDRNRCKGGHWVLHTEIQYQEWLKTHPKPTPNIEHEKMLEAMLYPMQRATFPTFIDSSFVVKSADKRGKINE